MGEVSDLISRISNAFRLFANLILGDIESGYWCKLGPNTVDGIHFNAI